MEEVRIARALLGTTPARLAAQIGAPIRVGGTRWTDNPTADLNSLAIVLRLLIDWYEGHDEPVAPSAGTGTDSGMELDRLVRRYLRLRSDWESRAARLLATRMGRCVPANTTQARPVPPPPGAGSPAARSPTRRRALLVDDASDVLVTVSAFLDAFGFEVLRAGSADQAMAILAANRDLALLVTDHAMPGMTGRDLVLQAYELLPKLRTLIITGYPDCHELAALPSGVTLLAKPFRRADLRARIQALFGESAEADIDQRSRMAGDHA